MCPCFHRSVFQAVPTTDDALKIWYFNPLLSRLRLFLSKHCQSFGDQSACFRAHSIVVQNEMFQWSVLGQEAEQSLINYLPIRLAGTGGHNLKPERIVAEVHG